MPIRFRCAYCNQLMAISRRKAGKVVSCPKCAGEIIVPAPEGTQAEEENAAQEGEQPFEDPKFGADFDRPRAAENPLAKAPTEAAGAPTNLTPDSIDMSIAKPRRSGLFMPMWLVLVTACVLLLLLCLMFGVGFFVGRSAAPPPPPPKKAAAVP
jgi:biopolymer transport protein ExbD